jgi:hypothetical protein
MRILLILNTGASHDYKLLVRLHADDMIKRVNELMKENKKRDAFNLIVREGEVEEYVPPGQKSLKEPEVILIEDFL